MTLLEEAIIYSTIMYQGMTRKINHSPFILHPLEVAQILSTLTDDQEVIAAGVLHDIVEDTDGTLPEIRKRFGERIARLVASETEEAFPGEDKAATWKKRKERSLAHLKQNGDPAVKMLWLADKLSNLRSLAGSYGELGDKVWEHLHQRDPESQRWYYKSVAEYVEMELNKTGAYKEYVDRINYIWPGTYESWKTKYREYREVSVEGCERIGKGAKGDVYRYNDELIVKVYNRKNTYSDVEREIALARASFVMGLPTAISFGIVSTEKGYGALFELINAKTLSELIAKNPEHVEYYAGIMAALARQIHLTQVREEAVFPDAVPRLTGWINRALEAEEPVLAERLAKMVTDLPAAATLVHGDFHTGNVFYVNGEAMFIDVDRLAVGNPVVDISSVYLFYVGYRETDPSTIEEFMGFSCRVAEVFFDSFIRQYLLTDDETVIGEATQKAALLAFVRLVGQIKKKEHLSERDRGSIAHLITRIRELADCCESIDVVCPTQGTS